MKTKKIVTLLLVIAAMSTLATIALLALNHPQGAQHHYIEAPSPATAATAGGQAGGSSKPVHKFMGGISLEKIDFKPSRAALETFGGEGGGGGSTEQKTFEILTIFNTGNTYSDEDLRTRIRKTLEQKGWTLSTFKPGQYLEMQKLYPVLANIYGTGDVQFPSTLVYLRIYTNGTALTYVILTDRTLAEAAYVGIAWVTLVTDKALDNALGALSISHDVAMFRHAISGRDADLIVVIAPPTLHGLRGSYTWRYVVTDGYTFKQAGILAVNKYWRSSCCDYAYIVDIYLDGTTVAHFGYSSGYKVDKLSPGFFTPGDHTITTKLSGGREYSHNVFYFVIVALFKST